MAKKLTVNSDPTLQEAHDALDESYRTFKFVRITMVEGIKRSLDQNSMNFELYTHIGEQLYGKDLDHARAECKLDFGISILRRDDEAFNDMWQRTFLHTDREQQLAAMKYVNVTSLMTRGQNAEFINQVLDHYAREGVGWPDYLIKSARHQSDRQAA
jgi:hypothetical protein